MLGHDSTRSMPMYAFLSLSQTLVFIMHGEDGVNECFISPVRMGKRA